MFPEKYNLGKRLGGGRKEGAPKLPLPLGPEQEDTRRRLTLEGYLTSLARLCQSEPVCEGGDQEARESLERREDGEGWGADVPRMLQQERGCRGPQQVRRYAHTT